MVNSKHRLQAVEFYETSKDKGVQASESSDADGFGKEIAAKGYDEKQLQQNRPIPVRKHDIPRGTMLANPSHPKALLHCVFSMVQFSCNFSFLERFYKTKNQL